MYNKSRFILCIYSGLLLLAGCSGNEQTTLSSPDQKIQLTFSLDQGTPQYEVRYLGKTFIQSSAMGLKLEDQPALNSDFSITGADKNSVDDTWDPLYGTSDKVHNHYNELTIELQEQKDPSRKMNLIFRTYNDGVAFRYEVPEQENISNFSVTREQTVFHFAGDYSGFGMKRTGFDGNYEAYYLKRKLSEIEPDTLIAMPFLLQLDNGWAAVTEANLSGYAGMSLTGSPDNPNELVSTLAPLPDQETIKATVKTPFRSPWRTIMLGKRAGDLITSNLIMNLNDSSKLNDNSYIHPGHVIWPWWNGRIADDLKYSGEPSTSVMKYYIDFAAENRIPNLLVDAGWYSLEGEAWASPEKQNLLTMEETRKDHYDIRKVIDYGNQKGVKVHLWVHATSLKDSVEKVLSTYADWGVSGIKVDSYGGDNQQHIADIQHIVRIAAKYHLIVDFHGAYKPTGWERSYPNFMTREAIMGLEFSKGNPKPDATHNVTIPYTRMLAGAMDYTPGAFDLDGTEEHPKQVQTTRAQQIAMYVVYYSPLQMLVDYPSVYKKNRTQFQFVLDIPTTWSESKFIDGEPSQYIVMARRNGKKWFIGAMTNKDSREISIPLNFLEEGQQYNAQILSDGADANSNPGNVTLSTKRVSSTDTINAKLAGSGGEAVILTPAD